MNDMFIACPNCKYVWFTWNADKFSEFTAHVVREKQLYSLTCPMCYAEMKVVEGETPKTCHHGISENYRCRLCEEKNLDKKIEETIEKLNSKKKHK